MQALTGRVISLLRTRLIKTGIVGLTATVVDLGTLTVLIQVFGWSPQAANVPSLVIPLAIQFFGNRHFVFGSQGNWVGQAFGFLMIEFSSLGVLALTFHFAVQFIPIHYTLVRMVCTTVVFFGFSYPLWKLNFLGFKRAT